MIHFEKRESAVEDLWQAKKCRWEVLGTELSVVIRIAGRQACWLAWMNLGLRSLISLFFFSSPLVFIVSGLLLVQRCRLRNGLKPSLSPRAGSFFVCLLSLNRSSLVKPGWPRSWYS